LNIPLEFSSLEISLLALLGIRAGRTKSGTFLNSNGVLCKIRYFAGKNPVARYSQSRKLSRTARAKKSIEYEAWCIRDN
jgi:hypothetical protein